METATSATFLNLDLEFGSASDLSQLAKHFEARALVLFCGPVESGFRLVLEPLLARGLESDPLACTEHFLHALETLPQSVSAVLPSCTSRVLDYGFSGGGREVSPLQVDLPASMVARAAKLALSVRITIYPPTSEAIGES